MKCVSMKSFFCNNCGQQGHSYNICKNPIMSNGVVAFRVRPGDGAVEYLAIRRQNTLGFIDFVRGKYSLQSKKYLAQMFRQMTGAEKRMILEKRFDRIWDKIWNMDPIGEEKEVALADEHDELADEHDELADEDEDDDDAEDESRGDPVDAAKGAATGAATGGGAAGQRGGIDSDCWVRNEPSSRLGFAARGSSRVGGGGGNRGVTLRERGGGGGGGGGGSGESRKKTKKYKSEESRSRDKYYSLCQGEFEDKLNRVNFFDLQMLIDESDRDDPHWSEAEWGFPKGRRENGETDYSCAVREFSEETGYPCYLLQKIRNIMPFEETFTGSNFKSYKHKYYLMYMNFEDSHLGNSVFSPNNEISLLEWKTFEGCMENIRFYNFEKKEVLAQINACVKNFLLLYEVPPY